MSTEVEKKASRRGCKGALTREINSTKRKIALNKPQEVENSLEVLEKKFTSFEEAHNSYHAVLKEETQIEESEDYFGQVEQEYVDALLYIRNWLDSN